MAENDPSVAAPRRPLLLSFLVGLSLTLAGVPAWAQSDWALLSPAARGVDPIAAATFRDLLQGELHSRLGGSFSADARSGAPCRDAACASQVGAAIGARFVVFSGISALGSKLVVSVSVVEVSSGALLDRQQITVSRVEELDLAATRIAAAIAEGKTTADTASLGTLTAEEARPPLRQAMDRGAQLRIGAIVPFGAGYADSVGAGVLFDLAYWLEARDFAFEPRLGIRFDAVTGEQSYGELPIDLGAFYILGGRELALFVGGGLGVRYLWETRGEVVQVGQVLPSRTAHLQDDSGWGFGAYGRLGLLIARTHSARISVIADYNITAIELNGQRNPMALSFAAGVIY